MMTNETNDDLFSNEEILAGLQEEMQADTARYLALTPEERELGRLLGEALDERARQGDD